MRRAVDYKWRLAEILAKNGMHNSTDVIPFLRERGIDLSASQVYRLVTQEPERVSLKFIAAICDIFDCTPADLITTTAADQRRKQVAGGNVVELSRASRPRPARVVADDD
jgi:DNA-binding Xre family transcriptional regulator